MTIKGRQRLDNFGRALARLTEALGIPADAPLAIDGTIQRFGFTFELAWKTLKDALSADGVEAYTPKEVLREAFRAGWISDETAWTAMLRDRNMGAHVYKEGLALEIYGRIRTNVAALAAVHQFLSRRYPPTADLFQPDESA